MSGMTISRGAAILAAVAALVLSGCDSNSEQDVEGSDAPTISSVQADVPAGFDVCEDVPGDVLSLHKLIMPYPDKSDAPGGLKWRGCIWVQSDDGYGAAIQTTNVTVGMVEEKNFTDAQIFSIDGRRAISSRQIEERLDESCTTNVEMYGGSLQVSITNPPSSSTSDQDTCELARELARSIAPSLPALN